MSELVDEHDLGSCAARRPGSSPGFPTTPTIEGFIGALGLKTTIDHSLKLAKRKRPPVRRPFLFGNQCFLNFDLFGYEESCDLLFCETDGTPLSRYAITRWFQNIPASAGIETDRVHDLRHICATLLLAQGVQIQVVMGTLGQSHMATTADIYSHVLPYLMVDAADKMNMALTGV